MSALIVTGTDTDVGKTMLCAGLTATLPNAFYWKPIQAGTDPETDSETVARLSGLSPEHLLPEAYCLATPASPHLAAQIDGVVIQPARLGLPQAAGPVIVEGAGGALVPINEQQVMADLFAQWHQPTLIVARTGLGTINHTLMTVEVLRARQVPVAGILFSGDRHEENERIIPQMAHLPCFGRLPRLHHVDRDSLKTAMRTHIDLPAIEALIR